MKRLISLLLVLMLALALAGCGSAKPENNAVKDEVKVIPKPKKQKLAVASIDQLHAGMAQDIAPDGKTLLFSWDMGLPDPEPNDEMGPVKLLHTLNLADGSVKKISQSNIHQGGATYSPDGKNIAFLENEETFYEAYLMENQPKAEKKQIHKSDYIAHGQIVWTPDAQNFVVSYYLANDGKIVMYDTKGNEKATFKQNGGIAIFPQFLDNDTLLYVAVNQGSPGLNIMAVDVSNPKAQPKKIVSGNYFTVAPNKRSLARVVNTEVSNQWQIEVQAVDDELKVGDTLAQVTVKDSASQMVWSPDSNYLLYSEENSIWALNPQTGAKKQLVSDMGHIANMLWQDNKNIIFTAYAGDYNYITYKMTLE